MTYWLINCNHTRFDGLYDPVGVHIVEMKEQMSKTLVNKAVGDIVKIKEDGFTSANDFRRSKVRRVYV